MKKLVVLLIVITGMAALLAGCGSTKLSDAFDKDTVEKTTKQVIDDMNAGDFDSVCAMFGDELKSALPASTLKEGYDKTLGGQAFVEYKSATIIGQKVKGTGEDAAVAVIVAKYEKKKAIYTISFNTDMKIIGIYMK